MSVEQEWETAKPDLNSEWESAAPVKAESKYGNALNALKTISPLLTPGGPAISLMSKLGDAAYEVGGKVTDVSGSPALGTVANVAMQAGAPMGGAALGRAAAPLMEKAAHSLMQSAVKPTLKQLQKGDARKAIDTMFSEGINPTEGGVRVLKEKIGKLNDEISQIIKDSTETIKVGDAGKPLLDTLKRFQNQVSPQDDVNAITRVWAMYRNHPAFGGREEMPIQLAQKLKQGTYRQIEKKYGELGAAETEAQKAIARGLKEEIAVKAPQVSAPNAKESELINALTVIERRALMDLNKNPMSLSLLTHNPATFAAFMADKSALFKSLAARMLKARSIEIPEALGASVGAGYDVLNQKRE